jgi:hypothetical protein
MIFRHVRKVHDVIREMVLFATISGFAGWVTDFSRQ